MEDQLTDHEEGSEALFKDISQVSVSRCPVIFTLVNKVVNLERTGWRRARYEEIEKPRKEASTFVFHLLPHLMGEALSYIHLFKLPTSLIFRLSHSPMTHFICEDDMATSARQLITQMTKQVYLLPFPPPAFLVRVALKVKRLQSELRSPENVHNWFPFLNLKTNT